MSVGALNFLKGGQRTAPPSFISCVCTLSLLCSSCHEALVDKATAAPTLVLAVAPLSNDACILWYASSIRN